MKALRRFTVRAHLPERLAALDQLSTNLRWSWDKPTQDLFAAIDPALWEQCGHDPVALLGAVNPARLDELALDAEFLGALDELAADLNDYLSRPLWYQEQQDAGVAAQALPTGIAYFSLEFGVAEVLPNYSGGLGILAGDHLKSASDLGVPLIAVGLYYRSGYFRQSLTADGWQHETYPSLDPQGLPLRLLTDANGDPVLVEVALGDNAVLRARIWVAQVGRVPLLLLDSDIPENEHDLRNVTDRLYGGDQEHRIKQEILAGIGGVRAIRAYTAVEKLTPPEVFHMNEGHAGFLGIERIRELVTDAGLDFDTALTVVRSSTVFTTHTPVPAGIDRFPVADENRRDDLEAGALYDLLAQAVAPKFYERDERGVPQRWVEMVRHTLQTLGPKVLASRMVRDYVEHYYAPAAQSFRRTAGAQFDAARELADYRRRAEEAWPKIEIADVDSTGLPDTPLLGSQLTLTATVRLAGLRPNDVTVQGVLGRVDAGDVLMDPVTVEMAHTGTGDGGYEIFSTTTPLPLAGPVGYTVRVLPRHPMLAASNELGLVTLA